MKIAWQSDNIKEYWAGDNASCSHCCMYIPTVCTTDCQLLIDRLIDSLFALIDLVDIYNPAM